MFKKASFLFIALFIGATLSAQNAPKYGHMNLGNLLEMLPDTKKANDELKVFADKLGAQDDSLARALQSAAELLQKEYDAGNLTPVQAQQRQAELQKQQEFLQKFEQEANQMVTTKREELLKPILTRVDEAIRTVAKENGYLMIFDTSTGAMLFANETDDVTALVKAKLGIN
ncbi:MAG: OmpH family outer membrane protein [Chitinophagales bacterium]|nr:OmpH family outer membrane protein [Chitinophagales bacterium]